LKNRKNETRSAMRSVPDPKIITNLGIKLDTAVYRNVTDG